MTTTRPHLMSRPVDGEPSLRPPRTTRLSRTWTVAIGDGASFALVGVAAVGLVFETFDWWSDNRAGISAVCAGAGAGAVASLVYGRLEGSAERAARVRLWVWTLVRFFVAFEMMRYGTAKVVGMQFYTRYYFLDTRPADMTPMALAWTFFGRTYGYQAISGVVEITSAALLAFRRTAALGACVLLAAMVNIVLLNFFYDVPIKLFSSIYLVMGLYVLSPDARRFWVFFLGEGPVPPRAYLAALAGRSTRRALSTFTVVLVLVLPAADIVHKAAQRGVFHTDRLEGAWTVVAVTGGGAGHLPVEGAWDKVYFEKGDYGFVQVGARRVRFDMEFDDAAGSLRLFDFDAPKGATVSDGRSMGGTFSTEGRRLHIDASYEGQSLSVELTRELPGEAFR
jgi:hypothetical protein